MFAVVVRQLDFQAAETGESERLTLRRPLSTLLILKTPKSFAASDLTALSDRGHASECPRLVWVVRCCCRIVKELFVK
jgi:hypothetical protein